jgi:O-antigen/teichoic acid export membrane protein
MAELSLGKRYIAKLFTNFIGLLLGLITTAIIPRGLGPNNYGNFEFLTNFFAQLLPFLTFATSFGFYTKLSQRQTEPPLVIFYTYLTGIAFVLLFLFIGCSYVMRFEDKLWPSQTKQYVYMAAIFAVLTWLVTSLNQIVDAYGITVTAEVMKVFQKIIGLLLVLLLFLFNWLSLYNFFIYQYILLVILIIAFIVIIRKKNQFVFQNWTLPKEQLIKYIKEFYGYSQPLFSYALIGVIVGILDRWLLQLNGGSIQQGFFGFALKIGSLSFVFTSAMSSLIMREFSITYQNSDTKGMAIIFRRFIPLLYSIAAFFSCYSIAQADKITYIFGGKEYGKAITPIMIMALYPIHQTYGQLSGSVFYATGQTKLFRNIGLFFMLIGLPIIYFFLAPIKKMGLNLGATGLALKFVILQFMAVNVQLYFNARYLKLNFWYYLSHQLLSAGLLLLLAYAACHVFDKIFIVSQNIVTNFIISGILYSFFVAILTAILPSLFGLKKSDIVKIKNTIYSGIKNVRYTKFRS